MGGRGQPTPGMEKGGLGDTLSGMNNITWRTDDNDDDEDDGARQNTSRDRQSRRGSPRGWGSDRDSSSSSRNDSSRRNLNSDFDNSSLSDSYRIPRSSGSLKWSDRGSSTRRDSMHDRSSRSGRSGSRGSMNQTWGGRSGR